MRLAVPIWEDRISPVLDTASNLLVVEIKGQREASRFQIHLDEKETSRICLRIRSLGIDTLLCGAVSRTFLRMLTASGIRVIPEISGSAEDVIAAYRKGSLFHARFRMPGCRRKRLLQQIESEPQDTPCSSRRRRARQGEKRDCEDEGQ